MKITREIAYPIVQKLEVTLDYNLNIIDDQGIIIASTNHVRIDSLHEGARYVLQTKQPLILNKDDLVGFAGTKEGVNLPIEFMGEIIGVVGITGSPDELMQLAQMTKITVELMLQYDYLQKQAQFEHQLMHSWVMELISPEIVDETKLSKDAKHFLKIDLQKEIAVFLVELPSLNPGKNFEDLIKKNELKVDLLNYLKHHNAEVSFSGITNDNQIILGMYLNNKKTESQIAKELALSLQTKYKKQSQNCMIAVGNRNTTIKGIRQSYFEAKQCLNLMKRFNKNITTSQINDWGLIKVLDSVPMPIRKEFLSQYPISNLPPDLLETLHVLFECDHNLTKTAEKLYIHRNTLAYRLENIHQLLKLNPKSGNDITILNVLTILQKLGE
jgi:carbohydrate diacid regulator